MSKTRMFHNILNFSFLFIQKIFFLKKKLKLKLKMGKLPTIVEGAIMVLQNGLVFSPIM